MGYILENQIFVQVLGSGSKGNAVLLGDVRDVLLVDAGLSGRELIKRFEATDTRLNQLAGVLLTHEHNDHVRGLKGLLKAEDIPLWANIQTSQHLMSSGYPKFRWNTFDTGMSFCIEDFSIHPFQVPHDAYDPCGFMVTIHGIRIGILTDLGYCTDTVRHFASKCHVLCLEANYDTRLLADDTKRPWATKQRISARHGHLSNEQASELLASFAGSGSPLRHVILVHMSEDCNDADIAVSQIKVGLKSANLDRVQVHLSYQNRVSERVVV